MSSVDGYIRNTFSDGELIVTNGDIGTEMYIITQGEVEATKTVNGETIVLARLKRGEFFGEMSLLEGMPRSADVRAVGDTEVLSMSSGGLLLRIRRDPTFALEMLQVFSSRLRHTTEMYEEEVIKRQALEQQMQPVLVAEKGVNE
ncbi:MAG: Crp/Fnr family transcriptional regulator [Pontibacterium sp.]